MAIATATELQAVSTVTRRLQTALQHAKEVKSTSSIDPPLSTASLEDDIDQLQADIDPKYDQNYRYAAIETAARDIFYTLITSLSIDEPAFIEVWNLLDILLAGGDRGICAPELVVWLIEELLDSQTTEGCRTVFDYLESRRERLAQKDFHKKNLVFLRSCNELLRRLSRAEDASFCGRVFFFLFQTFPLGDKSSVNLRGEFHVENVTTFDEDVSMSQDTTQTPSEQVTDGDETTKKPPTAPSKLANKAAVKSNKKEEEILESSNLYPIFWRLQQAFSVPTRLLKPAELQAFKAALTATIAKFKRTPTVVQASVSTHQQGTGEQEQADYSSNYNPKYLTSRDLFDLELSDLAFQRHIFVQALILLDFLLSLTESAKQKILDIEHPNKSMLYDFALSTEDAQWAVDTKKVISEHFKQTADGRFYDRSVNTILARDRNWIRWKIESCPSIVRDAMTTEEILDVRTKLERHVKPRRIDMRTMGAMDLDFLEDDQAGGLEALRDAARFAMPTADQLLGGIKTDELDLEMAFNDEEKGSLTDMIQNKTWRLLREVRTSQLALLDKYENGKSLQDVLQPPTVAVDDNLAAVETA